MFLNWENNSYALFDIWVSRQILYCNLCIVKEKTKIKYMKNIFLKPHFLKYVSFIFSQNLCQFEFKPSTFTCLSKFLLGYSSWIFMIFARKPMNFLIVRHIVLKIKIYNTYEKAFQLRSLISQLSDHICRFSFLHFLQTYNETASNLITEHTQQKNWYKHFTKIAFF